MPLKERLNWVSIAKTVIAIVVIVMLGWYLIQVDFKEVWAQVSAVRWSFGYVMITTCTAYLLATEAWRQCFPKDLPLPSLGKMFMIRQIGETLTMLTPANVIGGEASKVYMLDKYGIPSTASTSSVVISRGLIILSYLSLGVVAGVLILLGQAQRFGVVAFLIVCAGVIVGGIVGIRALRTFILSRDKQKSSFSWMGKFLEKATDLLNTLFDFAAEHRRQLVVAYFLSLLHWLVGTMEFFIILNALGIECSYVDAFLVEMGVMVFKSIGGFIPGQIGIEEYGNKVMLGMLSVANPAIWIVVSILRRARQLAWILISLIFVLTFMKIKQWKFSL